jgi:hypothetical protein
MDTSPAAVSIKGESPKLSNAGSPPSNRGGKRGQPILPAARGKGKRGRQATNDRKPEDASPKAKAKTSADIMAEVKAEMAAEEERKKRKDEEAEKAGLDDPSKNPIYLAEVEAANAGKRDEELIKTDPAAFVESAWQELMASQGITAANVGAANGDFDAMRSIMAMVGQEPPAGNNVASEPAPSATVGAVDMTSTASGSGGTNDASIFFDFDLFDAGPEEPANTTSTGKQQDSSSDPASAAAGGSGSKGDQGESLKATNELADALGLPSLSASDDVAPAAAAEEETPELISSSSSAGVPSAASSSTSSSVLIPPKSAAFPAQLFDEAGYLLPQSASPTVIVSSGGASLGKELGQMDLDADEGERAQQRQHSDKSSTATLRNSHPDGNSKADDDATAGQDDTAAGKKLGEEGEDYNQDEKERERENDWWDADHFSLYAGSDDKPWALLS